MSIQKKIEREKCTFEELSKLYDINNKKIEESKEQITLITNEMLICKGKIQAFEEIEEFLTEKVLAENTKTEEVITEG